MQQLLTGFMLLSFIFATYAAMPYKGQHTRDIKSLSASDIDAYMSGKGMGLAKVAELNHYPGPRHVLELAVQLQLSEVQKEQTQKLFKSMQSEASAIGKQIVDHERQLDELFSSGMINNANLQASLQKIATLKASLRYSHLKTHITQKRILTANQIGLYDRLRGYTGNQQHHQHDHKH